MEHPQSTGGTNGERAPVDFIVSEDISAFSISPAHFLASRPDVHNLIAGTMIFRSAPGSSPNNEKLEILLLQRAPSDSFPLKWEIPAGTADPTIDRSIAGVAVRELWEETQLRAKRLLCTVGLGLPDGSTNMTLVGEAQDARMDHELNICLLRVEGLTWAIVTFIVDVDEGSVNVVLRPDEHVDWKWAGENEVEKGQFRYHAGVEFEFVSEAMKMTVLEGFRLRKAMI